MSANPTDPLENSSQLPHIGVLVGSSRPTGNARGGLQKWLINQLNKVLKHQYRITVIFPDDSLPIGPVVADMIPAGVSTSEGYDTESIRRWSQIVEGCVAFVIFSCQYNWGYPGELKNALDQLYQEWNNKPVLIITYGGHGGNKCNAQLRQVLQGGLKMRVIPDEIMIPLPKQFIQEGKRVKEADFDEVTNSLPWLQPHEQPLAEGIEKLVKLLN